MTPEETLDQLVETVGPNVSVPDPSLIRNEAARQARVRTLTQRAGAAICAVLLAVGIFAVVGRGETTPVATANEELQVPTPTTSVPSGEIDLEAQFREWVVANEVGAPITSIRASVIDSDESIDGVRMNMMAFPLDGGFEYFAMFSAACGPDLFHGMIEFDDNAAVFRRGRLPETTSIGFDGVGWNCKPPQPNRLKSILASDLQISLGTDGISFSNSTEGVTFQLTDFDWQPLADDVGEKAPDSSDVPNPGRAQEAGSFDGLPPSADPNPFDNRYGYEPIVVALDDGTAVIINTINAGGNIVAEVWDTDTKELLATAPSEFGWRHSPSVAWTGAEVLLVGGSSGPPLASTTIAFNPASATWRSLADLPIDDYSGVPAAWTGSRMILPTQGLAVDPSAGGAWEPLAEHSTEGSPELAYVWDGSGLFVLESCSADFDGFANCPRQLDGSFERFDSTKNERESLPTPPVAAMTSFTTAVVDGDLIVHAYSRSDDQTRTSFLLYDSEEEEWSSIDGPDTIGPDVLASSTQNAAYFLVEQRTGQTALYKWQDSAFEMVEIATALPSPKGNSMAVNDGVVILAGPNLTAPFIERIDSP